MLVAREHGRESSRSGDRRSGNTLLNSESDKVNNHP